MKVQLAKWGNSTAVRLPKAVVRRLGLSEGMVLDLSVDDGALKLAAPPPALAPDPITLDWIISEMRRLGLENEPETVDWGSDLGSEVVRDDAAKR